MTEIKALGHDEYQELLDQEGDTVPLYVVAALHFEPPIPMTDKEAARRANADIDDDNMVPFGMQTEYTYATALLLNVDTPAYHKDYDGTVVFILPSDVSKIDYEMLNAIHPEHGAWAYRVEPRWWNPYSTDAEDDPMSNAHWRFKELKIPEFDINVEGSH